MAELDIAHAEVSHAPASILVLAYMHHHEDGGAHGGTLTIGNSCRHLQSLHVRLTASQSLSSPSLMSSIRTRNGQSMEGDSMSTSLRF